MPQTAPQRALMFLIGDTCSQHMLEVSARSSSRSIVLRKVYAKCTHKVSPSYQTKRIAKQTSGQKHLLEKKPGDSSCSRIDETHVHIYIRAILGVTTQTLKPLRLEKFERDEAERKSFESDTLVNGRNYVEAARSFDFIDTIHTARKRICVNRTMSTILTRGVPGSS